LPPPPSIAYIALSAMFTWKHPPSVFSGIGVGSKKQKKSTLLVAPSCGARGEGYICIFKGGIGPQRAMAVKGARVGDS